MRTHQVNAGLTEETYEALSAAAEANGMSRSAFASEMVQLGLCSIGWSGHPRPECYDDDGHEIRQPEH